MVDKLINVNKFGDIKHIWTLFKFNISECLFSCTTLSYSNSFYEYFFMQLFFCNIYEIKQISINNILHYFYTQWIKISSDIFSGGDSSSDSRNSNCNHQPGIVWLYKFFLNLKFNKRWLPVGMTSFFLVPPKKTCHSYW